MSTVFIDDTIVAVSTPPGQGGIGIVRLSGSRSLQIARQVFVTGTENLTPGTVYRGQVELDNQVVDDGVLLYFENGNSYTGEEVVELQLHGSTVVLAGVVSACAERGARLAEAGEFTKRAFLNGKLDLSQAESVADLIHAQSLAGAALAARQLTGGLADQVSSIRSVLVALLAQLEAGINFPEDEIAELSPDHLAKAAQDGSSNIDELLAGSDYGIRLREGVQVAIVGFPNAGKSSLFNALLQYDRAIVAAIPGTTRDTLQETMVIEGIPFVLHDTAGITDSEDEVEQLGIERSEQAIGQADLVLLVLDADQKQTRQDFLGSLEQDLIEQLEAKQMLLIGNKSDLADDAEEIEEYDLKLSAKTGQGLDQLRESLLEQVTTEGMQSQHIQVSNIRHIELLKQARSELEQLHSAIRRETTLDCLYVDLEQAVRSLGLITGEDVSEDVVDTVFSQFCVGK